MKPREEVSRRMPTTRLRVSPAATTAPQRQRPGRPCPRRPCRQRPQWLSRAPGGLAPFAGGRRPCGGEMGSRGSSGLSPFADVRARPALAA